MVEPRALSETFAASTQLSESDFAALAAAGYKTIINNRPDGEEPGQLTAAAARQLAQEHGLNYVHIPVKMPEISPTVVAQFQAALEENPGPILAHCKSGTRSSLLWAIAMAKRTDASIDELIQGAAQAGYDLTRFRPLIEQLAKAD
ncbi:MAG: TIGR01244 family sulfur transferase [Cyanobacteria bacterium P01_C01_bin.120]